MKIKLTVSYDGTNFCGWQVQPNGVTVQEFMDSEVPEKYILPPDIAVEFPKIRLTKGQAQKILDGVYEEYGYADGTYRVYNEDEFWGIGVANDKKLRIKAYVR